VLRDETKREIHFEKRTVEREAVVVRGSIADAEHGKGIRIYAENDADTGAGGGSGELGEFLAHVGDNLGIPLVNEVTDGGKTKVSWENHADAHFTGMDSRLEELTGKVLKNIATQTGLTFTREKRSVEVWFVSERQ